LCRRLCIGLSGSSLAGFAEFTVAAAAAIALLATGTCRFAAFGSNSGCCTILRDWLRTLRTVLMAMTTLAVAVMVRTALFRTAAGAPDFHQFRHDRRLGRGFGGSGFGRHRVTGDG